MKKHNKMEKTDKELYELDHRLPQQLEYLESLASEIGWFIMYFNLLEDRLDVLLRGCIRVFPENGPDEEIQQIIITGLQFGEKVELLKNLYNCYIENPVYFTAYKQDPIETKKIKDYLLKTITELKEINEIRNQYVHAQWLDNYRGSLIKSKVNVKQGVIKSTLLSIDKGEIKENAGVALELCNHLFKLQRKVIPEYAENSIMKYDD